MNFHKVYISLGSNEGDRFSFINLSISLIHNLCGKIEGQSSIYETAAWGLQEQPDFLNMVVSISTKLEPTVLLEKLLDIEKMLGRERSQKWGPRKMDLDILFFDELICNTDDLVIPHPYLHLRRFTLLPLNELTPELLHPLLKKTVNELLESCTDNLEVRKIE